MKKNLFVLFLLLSLSLSTFAQTATKKNSPAMKASVEISAKQLSDYLYFVASDEMEGRDTPSRGLDTTAKFIGMNLSRWGFKPAGDNGTYYQKIALKVVKTDSAKTGLELGGQKLTYGTDFVATGLSAKIENAPLVFGGNGWFIKSKNIDALKDIDVTGKIVVLYGAGLPEGIKREDLSGQRGVDWSDPTTYARTKGAVGVITVSTAKTKAEWEFARRQYERPSTSVEKLSGIQAPRIPQMLISQAVAETLFNGEPKSFSDKTSFVLKSEKTANFIGEVTTDTVFTQNVVAVWEGSDSVLKNEYVAIGAHYDHIGMSPNSPNADKISNGADDDGSGTVSVLAIAEALAKSAKRPKRSILLVWHCGEEKGLWGSDYFNKFPTVDIKQVTAQLNIDMIGRSRKADDKEPANKELSGENAVYVIGSNMMSSKLGEIVANTNKNYLKLDYDLRFDDPKDPNRFFFRSDHFNYALNGIPISFWFDGVHVDYHGVGDEPQKIDYVKMEKISRTIFLTMWELGDLKERPKIDKELPKELTQRQ